MHHPLQPSRNHPDKGLYGLRLGETLEIDYGCYSRKARREQALAVRESARWLRRWLVGATRWVGLGTVRSLGSFSPHRTL